MSIELSSLTAFTSALRVARSVDLAAYTLRAGAVRDALADAARSGARVRVRLERDPFDDPAGTLHAANADTVARLNAAGADAALTPAGSPVLHLKAAVVDGTAWLDDRNWAGDGPEILVRDAAPADVAAVAAALDGRDEAAPELRTTKAQAQALEIGVIADGAPAPVSIESESFGSGAVANALAAQARAGRPVRLLVAGREASAPGPAGARERARLSTLARLGVQVRTGTSNGPDLDEKVAVTSGAAWMGSANATAAFGPAGAQRDWGLVTRDPALVDGLRAEFERNWQAAAPLGRGPASFGRSPRSDVSSAARSMAVASSAAVSTGFDFPAYAAFGASRLSAIADGNRQSPSP